MLRSITFLPDGAVTTLEFFRLETRAIPPARESGRMSAGIIFLISTFHNYKNIVKDEFKCRFTKGVQRTSSYQIKPRGTGQED